MQMQGTVRFFNKTWGFLSADFEVNLEKEVYEYTLGGINFSPNKICID